MSTFVQSGGGEDFRGYESFATLEGLESFAESAMFHDFPASAATHLFTSSAPKHFQVLDLKLTCEFFGGGDKLFADEKFEKQLEELQANVCLLDETGKIIYTNASWRNFSSVNGGTTDRTDLGVNYLELCRTCTGDFVDNAQFFAEGLARSISGRTIGEFCFEYPCDSDTLARWYTAKVFTFHLGGSKKVTVVAHERQSEKPKPSTSGTNNHNTNLTNSLLAQPPVAPLSKDSSSRPLVVVQEPLPSTKDFFDQFKISSTNPPVSRPVPVVIETPAVTGGGTKKRKVVVKEPNRKQQLIFLSQGGPPQEIASENKIDVQREISHTESYLVVLRRKLVSLSDQRT